MAQLTFIVDIVNVKTRVGNADPFLCCRDCHIVSHDYSMMGMRSRGRLF